MVGIWVWLKTNRARVSAFLAVTVPVVAFLANFTTVVDGLHKVFGGSEPPGPPGVTVQLPTAPLTAADKLGAFIVRLNDAVGNDDKFTVTADFLKAGYGLEVHKPFELDGIDVIVRDRFFVIHIRSGWWKSFDETFFLASRAHGNASYSSRVLHFTGKFEELDIADSADGRRHLVNLKQLVGTGTGLKMYDRVLLPVTMDSIFPEFRFPLYEMNSGWGVFDGDVVEFTAQEDVSFATDSLEIVITAKATSFKGERSRSKKLDTLRFRYDGSGSYVQHTGPLLQDSLGETYGAFAVGDWFERPQEAGPSEPSLRGRYRL